MDALVQIAAVAAKEEGEEEREGVEVKVHRGFMNRFPSSPNHTRAAAAT
jgi:hypothetical protein